MSLLLLLLATVGYVVGLTRGRSTVGQAVATAQAAQLLAVLADTPTPENTATATGTATVTPTPLPTNSPTATPTPSPTPASPEEWLEQYRSLVLEGLNSISDLEFNPDRAQAILQRSAQEQGLAFATVSYQLLSEDPWAALAIPRNALGQSLPLLLWEDSTTQGRFRAQNLLTLLDISSNYNMLLTGVQFGSLRKDELGALHILLIERAGVRPWLTAYVLAQPEVGADFVLDWRSSDDPQWLMLADAARIEIVEVEGNLLPDIVIDAPVPPEGGLRALVNPPAVFVEQPPFAIQWINSRWSFAPLLNSPANGQRQVRGYRLNGAALRSTPLTTLGQIIKLARQQDLNEALNYATRLDVVQQAFSFGLGNPGVWFATYLDDSSQPTLGAAITPLLRLVDNGDRQRTFDAYFELDASGFYRLAAIVQAEPFTTDLITPAAPAATFTPTEAPTTEAAAQTPTAQAATTEAATKEDTAAAALGLPTPTDTPSGQRSGSARTGTATATVPNTQTATPTITATPTESPTITETPTPTPTETTTPTATPTDTATATDTPTPPLPLPTIFAEEVAPATGILSLLATANLRGGPGVDYVSLAPVEDQTAVGVFALTESGDWYLIRIEQPGSPYFGLVGWIFKDLLFINNSSAPLTVYRNDGTSLTPTPPTDTPVPGTPTPTPPPTWSPTPTPLQTPVLQEPESIAANGSNVPAPDADEQVFVIAGEQLPANPLLPLSATNSAGEKVNLRVDSATVQVWGGLFGTVGNWQPANAELLWPETTVYANLLQGTNPTESLANRIRIVGVPNRSRSELISLSALGVASSYGTAAALVGIDAVDGFSLLDNELNLAPLWEAPLEVNWLGSDELSGFLGSAPVSPAGENSFLWQRSDGSGLRIVAQPFHQISGVAGDAFGGLWWIEVPAIGLDSWQLWRYDPTLNKILLIFKGTSEFFPKESESSRPATLAPVLTTLVPQRLGDYSQVVLFFDSMDVVSQQLHTGFYRVDLRLNGEAPAELLGAPQLLLANGSYRTSPKLSPDGTRFAFLAYNSAQPSLTAGAIKPPNELKLLNFAGSAAGAVITVLQNETRFDFLEPRLDWLSGNRLLVIRSRFAAGTTTKSDRFAVAQVTLPASDNPTGEVVSAGFVVTGNNRLLDVAACRRDGNVLVLLADGDDARQLLRWDGVGDPQAVSTLSEQASRLFVCWSAPAAS